MALKRNSQKLLKYLGRRVPKNQAREILANLSSVAPPEVNRNDLEAGSARLQKIGVGKNSAQTMTLIAIDIAKSIGINPQEVIEDFIDEGLFLNSEVLTLLNRIRESDTRVGNTTARNNKKSLKYREIKA